MHRPPAQSFVYSLLRISAQLVGVTFYRLRVEGREHWPTNTGGLVCSNHQSFFDPPLIGMTCSRQMSYLARDTLFKVPILKQVMTFLDVIPIDREGSGLSGLKETLKRLRAGELVLIFPEGTRSRTSELLPFKKGGFIMAIKAQAPIVPVAISGGRDAMRKGSWFVRPVMCRIRIGEPIPTAGLAVDDRDRLIELVRTRIESLLRS